MYVLSVLLPEQLHPDQTLFLEKRPGFDHGIGVQKAPQAVLVFACGAPHHVFEIIEKPGLLELFVKGQQRIRLDRRVKGKFKSVIE